VPNGMSHSSPIPSSGYSTGCAGGTLASLARHCMPQKQTHQIAMTALHSTAPASGGFGPDRIGRTPCFTMASSSSGTPLR